jgi:predicted transcriptional regulator
LGESALPRGNNFSENKRNIPEIFSEVLDRCIVPHTKSQLMAKENLSSEMITDCLTQLKLLGLIEERRGPKKYATTKKGIEYLRRWAHLKEIIES